MNASDHAKAAQHWMEMAARAEFAKHELAPTRRRRVRDYQEIARTHALIALALAAVRATTTTTTTNENEETTNDA